MSLRSATAYCGPASTKITNYTDMDAGSELALSFASFAEWWGGAGGEGWACGSFERLLAPRAVHMI